MFLLLHMKKRGEVCSILHSFAQSGEMMTDFGARIAAEMPYSAPVPLIFSTFSPSLIVTHAMFPPM